MVKYACANPKMGMGFRRQIGAWLVGLVVNYVCANPKMGMELLEMTKSWHADKNVQEEVLILTRLPKEFVALLESRKVLKRQMELVFESVPPRSLVSLQLVAVPTPNGLGFAVLQEEKVVGEFPVVLLAAMMWSMPEELQHGCSFLLETELFVVVPD